MTELAVVYDILVLILKQKMEIMTIWNNEKNFIPKISLNTLWRVYNLLLEYKENIYFQKSKQDDYTIEMYSIKPISDVI